MKKNKPTLAIFGIKDRFIKERTAFVHDHNLCLMQDGKVLQYLQLERFSRRKYDNRLDEFIEDLIDGKLLNLPDDYDIVNVNVFVGNTFISKSGRLRVESNLQKGLKPNLDEAQAWFQYADWEGKEINAYECSHELAHIFSCLPFFGEFRENSLLVSFDGASSLCNFSAWHYMDGQIKPLEYHWKLGYLSKFFNDNFLSFSILNAKPDDHCSVPGKLMGYASWGNYSEKIEKWLKDNGYFKDYWDKELAIFQSIKENFGVEISEFNTHNPFLMDIAATFQHIFERDFIQKISELQRKTNAEYMYYAGGCALNIVTNTKLIEKLLFKNVFIPPCCNDSGLSLGAAAFLEWKKGNKIQPHSPYLCNIGLENENRQNEVSEEVIRQTAEILLHSGIIGVCNGVSEVGPRALGNRSLLALTNSKELAKRLSMEVKKREWYRPVAPIMLEKVARQVTVQPYHNLAKYMLLDFNIKPEFQNDLQGVVHANETARIQAVSSETDNPFIFRLLTYLYDNHGIMALINTSFNVQGEPIVHTVEQAMLSATSMNLQGLIVNNQLIKM
jgi:carbamoyltransferase